MGFAELEKLKELKHEQPTNRQNKQWLNKPPFSLLVRFKTMRGYMGCLYISQTVLRAFKRLIYEHIF